MCSRTDWIFHYINDTAVLEDACRCMEKAIRLAKQGNPERIQSALEALKGAYEKTRSEAAKLTICGGPIGVIADEMNTLADTLISSSASNLDTPQNNE